MPSQIIFLSDVDGAWSSSMGMTNGMESRLLRTSRYAMVMDNLVVKYIGWEDKPGVSVSGAENVLASL